MTVERHDDRSAASRGTGCRHTTTELALRRRELLRIGGLTMLGLGLGELWQWRMETRGADRSSGSDPAAARRGPVTGAARRCILIWLDGGPSHLETFDPKPDAPQEVRGPLESIATSVPGVRLSECLPQLARRMDRVAIIRSMTSPLGEHNFGTHYLMSGYKPTPVLEYPAFGSVAAHVRGQGTNPSGGHQTPSLPSAAGPLPQHVAVPDFRVGGSIFSGGGYLPAGVHPFPVGSDPSRAGFAVRDLAPFQGIDPERLDRRQRFLRQFNSSGPLLSSADTARDVAALSMLPELPPELEQAFALTTSPAARDAFDISREPDATRQKYGRKSIGQSTLLARRLIERGVPILTVNDRGWDTHQDLYTRLKEGYTGAQVPVGLVPSLDLALSGLLDDLSDRGLLDETLVVVMGEFGRTPKLNVQGGRDHWPRVFSVLLAGGGVRGGQIIGASDRLGEVPADRPVTPSDLVATIYMLLGIDPHLELHTSDGRPVRLVPHGSQVIPELLA